MEPMRSKIGHEFMTTKNIGAGLRWEAALTEPEGFFALPVQLRNTVAKAFANAVEERVREKPFS
jgi:hypothetical protein